MQKLYFLFISLVISFSATTAANAQVYGCKDPYATNYNAAVTHNDGSCTYTATTYNAVTAGTLSDTIKETSGLVYWNGLLWTHNDDTDPNLYAIDTTNGHIVRKVEVLNAVNNDWEDITQDNDYFYIGDFGNNGNGNRQNLAILRIAKAVLATNPASVTPDKIFFSYQDQTSFTATGPNNTDFDCEAFIAGSDSLYLFTKQWVSQKTKIYTLPKLPGTYMALPRAEYNIDGLVTGATYYAAKKTIVLSGYKIVNPVLQPFVCLLFDYQLNLFFSGNKRKINVSPLLHQTEGIATNDGRRYFMTNETIVNSVATIPAKLLKLDLYPYFDKYYESLGVGNNTVPDGAIVVYPNPANGPIHLVMNSGKQQSLRLKLINSTGQNVGEATYYLGSGGQEVIFEPATSIPAGMYWLEAMLGDSGKVIKVVYK